MKVKSLHLMMCCYWGISFRENSIPLRSQMIAFYFGKWFFGAVGDCYCAYVCVYVRFGSCGGSLLTGVWYLLCSFFSALVWISSVSRTLCKSAREVDNFIYVVENSGHLCGVWSSCLKEEKREVCLGGGTCLVRFDVNIFSERRKFYCFEFCRKEK